MTDELLAYLGPALDQAGISLSPSQLDRLAGHFSLLRAWNERINLTGITDPAKAARDHYLDSLGGAAALRGGSPVRMWVDVGSGGGFPGIPLAIACPEEHFILAESIGKKANFLTEAVKQLQMDARIVNDRVEAGTLERILPADARTDWGIVSRAIEKMDKQAPKLLKLPGLRRALFWLGETDAETLLNRLPSGWTGASLPLPSGERRRLVTLTRA